MITSWEIYWITRLDGIHNILMVLISLVIVAAVLGMLPICANDLWEAEGIWPKIVKAYKTGAAFIIACITVVSFTPTTKEFATIYLIPKMANNEQMQKVPENLAKLLNAKMEAWINDTLKNDEKKK